MFKKLALLLTCIPLITGCSNDHIVNNRKTTKVEYGIAKQISTNGTNSVICNYEKNYFEIKNEMVFIICNYQTNNEINFLVSINNVSIKDIIERGVKYEE